MSQVTCLCHAYPFPHRLAGGDCSGADWAKSVRECNRSEFCTFCNCENAQGGCDVADGREHPKHGECFIEQRGKPSEYPRNPEDELLGLYMHQADLAERAA